MHFEQNVLYNWELLWKMWQPFMLVQLELLPSEKRRPTLKARSIPNSESTSIRYFTSQCWRHCVEDGNSDGSADWVSRIEELLYAVFWVFPRRLNFIYRHFGTPCMFHLHRQAGSYEKCLGLRMLGYLYGKGLARKYCEPHTTEFYFV